MFSDLQLVEATTHMRHSKLAKCWKEGFIKIQFHCLELLELAVVNSMIQSGIDVKFGKAPPGVFERQLFRVIGGK